MCQFSQLPRPQDHFAAHFFSSALHLQCIVVSHCSLAVSCRLYHLQANRSSLGQNTCRKAALSQVQDTHSQSCQLHTQSLPAVPPCAIPSSNRALVHECDDCDAHKYDLCFRGALTGTLAWWQNVASIQYCSRLSAGPAKYWCWCFSPTSAP